MPPSSSAEPLLDTGGDLRRGLSHEKGMSPAAVQLWRLDRACWHIQDALVGNDPSRPTGT